MTLTRVFFCASSDENAVLVRAFEERRGSPAKKFAGRVSSDENAVLARVFEERRGSPAKKFAGRADTGYRYGY